MRDFLTLKKRLVHNIQATDHWVNGLLSKRFGSDGKGKPVFLGWG
jgi:hypothetical protein